MTTHMSWETINDLADGRLSATERTGALAHIRACVACAAQVADLQSVLTSAKAIPGELTPPAEAWTAIADRIDRTKTVTLPVASSARPGLKVSRGQLAAAALVLVAASSAITSVVMRRESATGPGNTVTSVSAASPVTSEVARIEDDYLATASQLRATLERERAGLSASTIATVERSLALIDEAIAEAREALLNDPANDALRSLLRRSHEQKIEFLRRSTALLQKA